MDLTWVINYFLTLLLFIGTSCHRANSATDTGVQKKVSVSEVVVDSNVEDIQWCGSDHRTVLLKTSKGRIYKSKDGGKNWNEITDVLANTTGGGDGAGSGITVESIMVNPIDKNIILVVANDKNHFLSEDASTTFRRLRHERSVHSWQFHPARPRWALFSSWSDSCTNSQDKTDCVHQLYATKDLGGTIDLVSSYVVQFSWGDKTKPDKTDHIYFTHHTHKSGSQPRSAGWSKHVDLSVCADWNRKCRVLVPQGNKFLVSNGFIFVARLQDQSKQTVTMYVSSDGTDNFVQTKLPEAIQEKSYTILDTSEGTIMLHVNHGSEQGHNVNTGNVYISDSTGARYTLSLPNNVRTSTGECEFDKVLSLEGVYIANFKDDLENRPDSGDDAAREQDQNENASEQDAVETAVDKKRKPTSKGKSEAVIRTVISFDKGGKWAFLPAPKIDSRGVPVECHKNNNSNSKCWLHLHGITNFHQYAPFYSVDNAVGVIMGTGNVGSHLRFETDEVNTYLSRDGGLTWAEAHKGAFIYEFGDHGGLIVMADDIRKTKQVVFSWNEGVSWYDFDLGEYPIDIDNIVIEPNSTSVEFLVYGTRGDAGVVYHLDFMALGQAPCKGASAADSVISDYETWTPTDGRSSGANCMLGREVTYTRRKQTSECFNGKDFKRPVLKKNCVCTEEDYECELGFARRIGSLECRLKYDGAVTDYGCTSASYFYADAYRKVPGDSCEGGWVPARAAVPCPSYSPFSSSAKMVIVVVVLVGCLMFVTTYISNSPRLKYLFRNYGFETFGNVGYGLLGSAKAKDDMYTDDDNVGIGSSKYEPELGFIDSEQDEHEDDAPTLLSYTNNSNNSNSTSLIDRGLEEFDIAKDDEDNKTVRRVAPLLPTEPVPRLLPPPGSSSCTATDEEMELL